MANFEMPFFDEGNGNIGYFVDPTARSQIAAIGELKTWTPKLYDYNTYKRDLPAQKYVKVNKLYVMFLEGTFDFSDISTMIQIRNLPCQTCVGGSIFLGSLREASLSKGIRIQGDVNMAYPRPNVISSDFGTASSAERNKLVLFGYDS